MEWHPILFAHRLAISLLLRTEIDQLWYGNSDQTLYLRVLLNHWQEFLHHSILTYVSLVVLAFFHSLQYLQLTLLGCSLTVNHKVLILEIIVYLLVKPSFVSDQLCSIWYGEHVEHESLSVVHHVMEEKTFDVLMGLVAHEAVDGVGQHGKIHVFVF